jgi:phosphoribosyl-AMP cyclohydrolase
MSAGRLGCDHATVLLGVTPAGPACHTGAVSCFRHAANGGATLDLGTGSA